MGGQIFIAHSRHDVRLRQWFDTVFAGSDMKAERLEFEVEAQSHPPIPVLVEKMRNSKAVFLLLGPQILDSRHTINWVAAETGLARGLGKCVWVFEDRAALQDFPVPFADVYVPIDYIDQNVAWVEMILKAYSAWGSGPREFKREPFEDFGWSFLQCSQPGCRASFYTPDMVTVQKCPICLVAQRWQ